MALEDTNKIQGLVETNPLSTDPVSRGDDHFRLIKKVIKKSFPSDIDVQIPDVSDNEGKFLHVNESGNTEWADGSINHSDMSIVFKMLKRRSIVNVTDGGICTVLPGGVYYINGKQDFAKINTLHTVTVPATSTGNSHRYLYIDFTKIDEDLFVTDEDTAVYSSAVAPTITENGWYKGSDRCIGAVTYDYAGNIRGQNDNGTGFIQFSETDYANSRQSTGLLGSNINTWLPMTMNIPMFSDIAQLTFYLDSTDEISASMESYARTKGRTGGGIIVGRSDGKNCEFQFNSIDMYVNPEDKQIEVKGNVPSGTINVYTLGYHLPEGI